MASAHTHSPRDPMLELYGAVRSAGRRERRRDLAGEIARYLGAVSILLVGAVHAQQYYDAYFLVVPTIGFRSLFVLVILRHERRRLISLSVTAHPTAEWIVRSPMPSLGMKHQTT